MTKMLKSVSHDAAFGMNGCFIGPEEKMIMIKKLKSM